MAGNAAYLTRTTVTASMLTVSSEDTDFPKANLLNSIAAKRFKGTSTTTLYVEIDFGTATSLDALALINHNFTSAATFLLEADSSTPPSVSIDTPAYRQYDILSQFTSASYRYWRITVTDTNTEVLQFGELWPGVRVNFPRRYSFAQSKLISRGDIHLETQKGVFHHYTLFARRGRDYLFTPLTEAEAAQFETLDLAVGGRANPFVIIPDDTGTEMWFVRKRAEHVEEGSDTSFFSYRLNLIEESRGTDIEA